MFQQIEVSELCYNQKYKIFSDKTYIGIYKGKCWSDEKYLSFININKHPSHKLNHRYFLTSHNFYRFVSQKAKIQSDMEHRAVNLIISRIIGDEHFIW
jgi:hypothetical protein